MNEAGGLIILSVQFNQFVRIPTCEVLADMVYFPH